MPKTKLTDQAKQLFKGGSIKISPRKPVRLTCLSCGKYKVDTYPDFLWFYGHKDNHTLKEKLRDFFGIHVQSTQKG